MKRVAAGDETACRSVLDQHLAPAWRLALAYTGQEDLADDIAQTAMIRLWKTAPRWQAKAQISTWLFRVVHNLCIDESRRKAFSTLPEGIEIVDETESPIAQHALRQRADNIEQAMGCLPPRQRAAISLFYYEELSIMDAAHIMDIAPDAFQSLLARARRGLKDLLADDAAELMEEIT